MADMWKELDKNCKSQNIQLRPKAGSGIWLSGLLFFAFFLTILRAPGTIQLNYDVLTVLLFGMFLQSVEVCHSFLQEDQGFASKLGGRLMPAFITSSVFAFVIDQEVIFSCVTSLVMLLIYRFVYLYILKSFPLSFTLGEGAIVSQGLVVFIYNCFLKLPFINQSMTLSEDLNRILQIGLLGVLTLVVVTRTLKIFRHWILFYILLTSVIAAVCLVPLRNKPAVTILFNFIFSDMERVAVVGVYIGLLLLAGFAVTWQVRKGRQVTTTARKIFHILIVLVYVPGLIFQCQFLYVASVVILAIFIVLELARVIKLYPVSDALDASVEAFIDEKDPGKVALTPIYLLVGCSAPMWIHNSPCDLTPELLPLLSGVISIGIGDTFASAVGSKFGKHKWPDSRKSVEGTIASIFAQVLFIYALYAFGYLSLSVRLAAVAGVAVILNSLVEALTDQVDNLVLPILTYVVLVMN